MFDFSFNLICNPDSEMLDQSSNLIRNQVSSYSHMIHKWRQKVSRTASAISPCLYEIKPICRILVLLKSVIYPDPIESSAIAYLFSSFSDHSKIQECASS